MSNKVFNTEKTAKDYMSKDQPLFFGEPQGLFNTVYKPYPQLWALYKTMKSLDWSENEFDYTQCLTDFKDCPKSVYEMMIRTLSWQWEADSIASRSIAPLMAPFVSDSSLWAAWQRISDNEVVHASAYSEIVRMSFDSPEDVLGNILKVQESFKRLDVVSEVFSDLGEASHKYALGQISQDEAYDKVFMAVVALLLLERIQFIASFAVTFTICSSNWFQAIGKSVQKIAQDELEVHAKLDKEILKIELATERGRECLERNRERIKELADAVVESELAWADDLFSDGRELVGSNVNMLKQWVLFNARDVYTFLDIETSYKFPKNNPMPNLENWINIGAVQAAPQEQDNNQYKVGIIQRDDASVNFDVDF
jgi:ribonucleoside-diphosphate reductase beta chain